ncbi:MAG TPA: ion transporter [Dokdonella sp.]|uniref:ion transporter n=1 Tax=Dokdonella sp. TaxID=2291710 RepID=UPI002C28D8C8|nr:ion transporter [Dokdonella sp.]HUD42695.1 ion transporter [Dokdonella sp.]
MRQSGDELEGLEPAGNGWRARWFDIIFRHDAGPSRNFDLILVGAIFASVFVVFADSTQAIHVRFTKLLYILEWGFTLLFTAEYALRLMVVRRPLAYATSLWGIIDLLSILPTYFSLFVPGSQSLLVVRVLRLLRLFRILKLTRYVQESGHLGEALWRSRRKILIFLSVVLTLVVIFGAAMYVIEGPAHGFTSIPTGMYWAVVTVATVGFGDLTPVTPLGRIVTSLLILIGYGIIAVPTGIYTAELAAVFREDRHAAINAGTVCGRCRLDMHPPEANFCHRCGERLEKEGSL